MAAVTCFDLLQNKAHNRSALGLQFNGKTDKLVTGGVLHNEAKTTVELSGK